MDGFNALLAIGLSIVAFLLAYRFYGRFIDGILRTQAGRKGPSHTRMDGRDFVPTRRSVIFGHHFASIAGLGPIMGPAVAVYWGWVPAILWVVLGAIFFGAVHDYTTMMLSLRHNGRGIGDITKDYAGKRARFAFLIVIFFLLALGMGLFVITIAKLFVDHHPEAVLPTILLTLIAMLVGTGMYKFKLSLVPVTIIGVIAVVLFAAIGASNPIYIYQYSLEGGTDSPIWNDIEDKAAHGHFDEQLVLHSFGNAADPQGLLGRYANVDATSLQEIADKGISFAAISGTQSLLAGLREQQAALNASLTRVINPLIERYVAQGALPMEASSRAYKESAEARSIQAELKPLNERIRDLERSQRSLGMALPDVSKQPMLISRYLELGNTQRIDLLDVLAAERRHLDEAGKGGRTLQVSQVSHTKPGEMALYYRAAGQNDYAQALTAAGEGAATNWVYILLVYALFASILPVWLLLQPRDYINSFMLYAGLAAMLIGLFIWQGSSLVSGTQAPTIVAPEFTGMHAEDLGIGGMPVVFPFLFIIVACGAISGFHSLVSSGTSSRQVATEGDARPIAFGGMLLEGLLAVIVIVACTVGISRAGWIAEIQGMSFVSLKGAAAAISRFVNGGADFMGVLFVDGLGIDRSACVAFLATVCVTFAMTTLDSATRLLRYNLEEFGTHISGNDGKGALAPLGALLKNPLLASLGAVIAIGAFALYKVDGRSAGLHLLQLFGSTNQLLASIGLIVVTLWFKKTNRPTIYTLIPMVVMLCLSGWALYEALTTELAKEEAQNHMLIWVSGSLLVLAGWIALEGILAWKRPVEASEIVSEPAPHIVAGGKTDGKQA